ncbi:MAG: ABC transporter substrate-binding protein [Halarcobacter sp.]
MKRYFLLLVIIFIFNACSEKNDEDIKIGFIAGLSGKYSSLGTRIRDGFTLAFKEIDYTINNQKVVIIQKDDKQDELEAKKIIDNLVENNIKLIVGNTTSSMTKVSFPVINKQKGSLLISATASGSDFTKKDDNFLRIQVENSEKKFKNLKKYIIKNKNIVFIYDSKNKAYTDGYEEYFQKMLFETWGNGFVTKFDINKPYKKFIDKLKTKEVDLILIVANSIDSANIIQYLRLAKINAQILASGWSKTMDFIENGGKAVEGVLFSSEYNENSSDKRFLNFINSFRKTYNKTPSALEAQGYELGKILIENLSISSDISTLKQRILNQKTYKGLQGDIIFDKYGDVSREYFMMKIANAKYVKIDNEMEK